MQSGNKENVVGNGTSKSGKVEQKPSSLNVPATIAGGPVTCQSNLCGPAATPQVPLVEKKPQFGSRRVLGHHLADRVGKLVTVLGEVMNLDATGKLLKFNTTDEFKVLVASELPLVGLTPGNMVEVEGVVEKSNKIKMTSLYKYDPKLYLDSEVKVESGPQLNRFDKSLYNEVIETLHEHAEYMIIKDKVEHFGTDDPKDERSVILVDMTITSGDDEEDPTLGFENHGIDEEAVEKHIQKRKADEAEMDAEFADPPTVPKM